MICPLMSFRMEPEPDSDGTISCMEQECGVYNTRYNECSLVSISGIIHGLESINIGMRER